MKLQIHERTDKVNLLLDEDPRDQDLLHLVIGNFKGHAVSGGHFMVSLFPSYLIIFFSS